MKSAAITGIVAKIVSPRRRTTIPHPPCEAYWISTKNSPPSARLRKYRHATSHEKKNCLGFEDPAMAQATAPSTAQATPAAGMRFHGCPGGIVTCSGRSATTRSGIISGLQQLDAARAEGLQQRSIGRRIEPR